TASDHQEAARPQFVAAAPLRARPSRVLEDPHDRQRRTRDERWEPQRPLPTEAQAHRGEGRGGEDAGDEAAPTADANETAAPGGEQRGSAEDARVTVAPGEPPRSV